jgi:two-component system nitrogen regulation sensor histidine kinase NtrY
MSETTVKDIPQEPSGASGPARVDTPALQRHGAVLVALLALTLGVATFAAAMNWLPEVRIAGLNLLSLLLALDMVVIVAIITMVTVRVVRLLAARRRQRMGARLLLRLVALFAVISVVPALLVSVFAWTSLHFSIQEFFNDRVREALSGADTLVQSYERELRRNVEADLLRVAAALRDDGIQLLSDSEELSDLLTDVARERGLSEIAIYDDEANVVARSEIFDPGYSPAHPSELWFEAARGGRPSLIIDEKTNQVRALVKPFSILDNYVLVSRPIDAELLDQLSLVRGAVDDYNATAARLSQVEFVFALLFGMIALLLLLAAIWVGLNFSSELAQRITRLADAAERVGSGRLDARVETENTRDEISVLGRAFNRMTRRLASQQNALMDANRQLDERRMFTEAVLSGVSAGIIGLDAEGRITLPNPAAADLFGVSREALIGRPVIDFLAGLDVIIDEARNHPGRIIERQISAQLQGEERERTLLVRAVAGIDEKSGIVVTFDDITELMRAQRTAAWADVARRIAHEIKNPLTPIQLSAERLKRKYAKSLPEDSETLVSCTDTIVRQVGDIRRLVDEFSSFARMPQPTFAEEDLRELCQQALFLQRDAHPDIFYESHLADHAVLVNCDRQQIGQALTNLLQNAADAIAGRRVRDGNDIPARIRIRIEADDDTQAVHIEDTGLGLPKEDRDRLTEPYVTKRDAGTGLGLAIVKKVMEDHGGELRLEDGPDGGARVSLIFHKPATDRQPGAADEGDEGEHALDTGKAASHGS